MMLILFLIWLIGAIVIAFLIGIDSHDEPFLDPMTTLLPSLFWWIGIALIVGQYVGHWWKYRHQR